MSLEDIISQRTETLYADGEPLERVTVIEPDMEKIQTLLSNGDATANEIREILKLKPEIKQKFYCGADHAKGWTCKYCGSLEYEKRCTSCGAPRRE